MAKVIAPFEIVGRLDNLSFYIDGLKVNRVRIPHGKGPSKEDFKVNPVFQSARNQAKEFGSCAKKSQSFRAIAQHFNDRAKDGSYVGRANKLLFDVLQEDTVNAVGQRTVDQGMESEEARGYFTGFEGNQLRPLVDVLKVNWQWDEDASEFTINSFHPSEHIDWPDKAQLVHLCIARAHWDYVNNIFSTFYSEEMIFEKNAVPTDLYLKTKIPEGNQFELLYLFIGFSIKDRKRIKELKRANNTVSVIWSR